LLPVSATITDLKEAWVSLSESRCQATLDAVCVPWSEFPIVPSYPHYPQEAGGKRCCLCLLLSPTWRRQEAVQGSGSRVQGAGFRVQGQGSRVQGSGSRVQSYPQPVVDAAECVVARVCDYHRPGGGRRRFRVQGSGSSVQGPGSRVQGPGSSVQGPGFSVPCVGFT